MLGYENSPGPLSSGVRCVWLAKIADIRIAIWKGDWAKTLPACAAEPGRQQPAGCFDQRGGVALAEGLGAGIEDGLRVEEHFIDQIKGIYGGWEERAKKLTGYQDG